ncbi:MAG: aldolase/citrate lyase family protein [Acidobacteriota bacterium]
MVTYGPDWSNPVKTALREGRWVLGATVSSSSVEAAVVLAAAGFDFLWIEMEHAAVTLESARTVILATQGLPTVPLIRVPVNELWTAKRALDIGAMGVVFPFTADMEMARRAVAACHYGPAGLRGSGPGLASLRWPTAGESYHEFADRNVLVVAIVENRQGLENVEEIAAVPGLDVLFIGTSDLSYSLGYGGRESHPTMQEAIRRIVKAGRDHGVPLGRPLGDPARLEEFLELGFRFFQGPSDVKLLSNGAAAFLGSVGRRPKTMDALY